MHSGSSTEQCLFVCVVRTVSWLAFGAGTLHECGQHMKYSQSDLCRAEVKRPILFTLKMHYFQYKMHIAYTNITFT